MVWLCLEEAEDGLEDDIPQLPFARILKVRSAQFMLQCPQELLVLAQALSNVEGLVFENSVVI